MRTDSGPVYFGEGVGAAIAAIKKADQAWSTLLAACPASGQADFPVDIGGPVGALGGWCSRQPEVHMKYQASQDWVKGRQSGDSGPRAVRSPDVRYLRQSRPCGEFNTLPTLPQSCRRWATKAAHGRGNALGQHTPQGDALGPVASSLV